MSYGSFVANLVARSYFPATKKLPAKTLEALIFHGGEGGIRTHGPFDRTLDFESSTIDHSDTSPVFFKPHDCWLEDTFCFFFETMIKTDFLGIFVYVLGMILGMMR